MRTKSRCLKNLFEFAENIQKEVRIILHDIQKDMKRQEEQKGQSPKAGAKASLDTDQAMFELL